MRGYLRLYLLNLSAHLLRAGEHAEAADIAARTCRLAADAGDPVLQASSLSIRAAALRHTGPLDEALRCANEAAELQSARSDRLLALTLLRRAEVFEAMRRPDDARRDAANARDIAARHGDENLVFGARIWELLHAARSGATDHVALQHALDDATSSGGPLARLLAPHDRAGHGPPRLPRVLSRRRAQSWTIGPRSGSHFPLSKTHPFGHVGGVVLVSGGTLQIEGAIAFTAVPAGVAGGGAPAGSQPNSAPQAKVRTAKIEDRSIGNLQRGVE